MYSLINGSVWAPQSAYSTRRPEAAKQLVTAAQKVPQSLTSTVPEFDLLRRRTSILVTDVRDNPNVYREIAVASRCRAYVATRVVANGDVVGFIHADKVLGRNDVDNFDRNLLGLFGEAFGYILARAMIVDEANAVQSRLLSLAAGVKQAASGLRFLEQDPALARQSRQQCGPPDSTGPRGLPLATYGLTKRETQVLQLMTTGLDNAEIASRLYVAAGTVKSHVKHILRKLGASNRAEAVSLWFNSTLVTSS
jgi:DNA-binding CsgD family transcriptional regulator